MQTSRASVLPDRPGKTAKAPAGPVRSGPCSPAPGRAAAGGGHRLRQGHTTATRADAASRSMNLIRSRTLPPELTPPKKYTDSPTDQQYFSPRQKFRDLPDGDAAGQGFTEAFPPAGGRGGDGQDPRGSPAPPAETGRRGHGSPFWGRGPGGDAAVEADGAPRGGGRRGFTRFVLLLREKRLSEAQGSSPKAPSLLQLPPGGSRCAPGGRSPLPPQARHSHGEAKAMFCPRISKARTENASPRRELPTPLPGLPVLPAASPPCPYSSEQRSTGGASSTETPEHHPLA